MEFLFDYYTLLIYLLYLLVFIKSYIPLLSHSLLHVCLVSLINKRKEKKY